MRARGKYIPINRMILTYGYGYGYGYGCVRNGFINVYNVSNKATSGSGVHDAKPIPSGD